MPATARQLTLRALLEWEKGRSFSDEILHTLFERQRLSPLDRAFAMETFFGTLRNLTRLDFLIDRLREGTLDAATRAVLRLGLYQIFHMRTAAHAAVNETVELGGAARGLINAVLRRALREKDALDAALDAAPLAVRTSHPEFLIERWNAVFGADATQRLCAWNNLPAEVHVRANCLKVTTGELLRATPEATQSPAHPLMLKVPHLPFAWIANGLCYVQDPSTLLACDLLDPQPGERVLDACAGRGQKTSLLVERVGEGGHVWAADLHRKKLVALGRELVRLHLPSVRTAEVDWTRGTDAVPGNFDRVLVDAPCTGVGTLRRRPEIATRLAENDPPRLGELATGILRGAALRARSGGRVVFAVCSVLPEEAEAVVERVSDLLEPAPFDAPEIEKLAPPSATAFRLLPLEHGTDGYFVASFVRR